MLGTRYAEQPIELEIPIMITGMSYGALSFNAKVALARGAGAVGTLDHVAATAGCSPPSARTRRTMIVEVLPSRYGANVHHLRQADGIELTIGQGAKPGTGGLLLGSKVSPRDRRRSATCRPASTSARPRATRTSSVRTT